jgi:hypothetical protein
MRRCAVFIALVVCACGRRGSARYEGTVTDTALPDSQTSLSITALTWTDSSFAGVVENGASGGAGAAYGWFPNGVLTIVSVSPGGDTLLWKATSEGPAIGGTYTVTGGPSQGTQGIWTTHLVGGRAITRKSLTVADTADVGWMEVLAALGAVLAVTWLSLRWLMKIPRTPSSPPLATSLAPQLYGIGGWMLWFLIGQGLTILFMLARLPELWSADTQSSWSMGALLPGMRALLTIESAMHLGQIVLPIAGFVLTVKHHAWTARFWLVYLMYLAAYGIIDIAGAGLIQQRSERLMGNAQTGGEEGGVWVAMMANARLVIWALIWSLYWIRSIRVKQTFGRAALESDPA